MWLMEMTALCHQTPTVPFLPRVVLLPRWMQPLTSAAAGLHSQLPASTILSYADSFFHESLTVSMSVLFL